MGDLVLLSTKNINLKNPGSRKLLPKRVGPFKVVQKIGSAAYRLELPDTMKALHPVFHAALLTKYVPSGTVQPPPPIVLDDGDVLWRVETLLDRRERKRGRKKLVEYLVKWHGFGHEHNTWEPESNIADPDLITDYQVRMKAKETLAQAKAKAKPRRKAKR